MTEAPVGKGMSFWGKLTWLIRGGLVFAWGNGGDLI